MNAFWEAFHNQKTKDIPFIPIWRSANGQYGMMSNISIAPGKLERCVDKSHDGKRSDVSFVLIGTRFGTVVLYHQYLNAEDIYHIFFPIEIPVSLIRSLGIRSPVTTNMTSVLVGNSEQRIGNIGELIEDIFDAKNRYEVYLDFVRNGGDPLVSVSYF